VFTFPPEKRINTNIIFSISVSEPSSYQGQLQGIRDYVLKLGLFSNQQTTVENAVSVG
jgi:hypothetical protein